jgi:hypothetical protein
MIGRKFWFSRESLRRGFAKSRVWPRALPFFMLVLLTAWLGLAASLPQGQSGSANGAMVDEPRFLFSEDGTRLASAAGNGDLRILDLESGRELARFFTLRRVSRTWLSVRTEGGWLAPRARISPFGTLLSAAKAVSCLRKRAALSRNWRSVLMVNGSPRSLRMRRSSSGIWLLIRLAHV